MGEGALRAVLLGDANDLLDEEGRPVGEIRASETVRSRSRTAYALCPYRGSRQRATRLMNVSALNQLNSVWPQPLGVLSQVRRLHGLRPGAPAPLLQLCRAGFTALCLPAYLSYRSAPRTISSCIAASHKMTQGLFGLCKNLLLERVAQGEDYRTAVATVGELYRFAEQSGILLSRTGIEACAAPPELIGAALRLLVLGACDESVAALPAQLSSGEGAQLLAYGAAVADMTIWVTVAAIALRTVVERVSDAASGLSLDPCFAAFAEPALLADYRLSGFTDPVIGPVLDLHGAICHHYGLGAIALCSDEAAAARLLDVLARTAAPAAAVPATSWRDTARDIEDQLLLVFDGLQRRALAALDRPALPPASLAATTADAFGHLPSHYFARANAGVNANANAGAVAGPGGRWGMDHHV